ncbi:MAG TPA: hypothetical protein VK461_15550 [Acidimicrobiales bacterium]|nr:hypothetical protein [Acidimicrobiales bacterium]
MAVHLRDPNGLPPGTCYLTRQLGAVEDKTPALRFRYTKADGKIPAGR